MELREFVGETIKQIIDGVKVAQEYAAENNAIVNPKPLIGETGFHERLEYYGPGGSRVYHEHVERLEFDVTLSAADKESGEVGSGIFVGPVAIGGRARGEGQSSEVSRIKFSVPLILPIQE